MQKTPLRKSQRRFFLPTAWCMIAICQPARRNNDQAHLSQNKKGLNKKRTQERQEKPAATG